MTPSDAQDLAKNAVRSIKDGLERNALSTSELESRFELPPGSLAEWLENPVGLVEYVCLIVSLAGDERRRAARDGEPVAGLRPNETAAEQVISEPVADYDAPEPRLLDLHFQALLGAVQRGTVSANAGTLLLEECLAKLVAVATRRADG